MKIGNVIKLVGPTHPGLLVKECLDNLGLSIADAAPRLGLTGQQLNDLIAGRTNMTPEIAEGLEKTVGNTADTWLRVQRNYDLRPKSPPSA